MRLCYLAKPKINERTGKVVFGEMDASKERKHCRCIVCTKQKLNQK